jgi:membrane protease YdiL (CAAX protease family)
VPRLWPVFAVYVAAFIGILVVSLLAALVVHEVYPELSPEAALQGLPGLVIGALASSSVLLFAAVMATRPFQLPALRLLPGRERGVDLAVMIVGTLALGQALDSAAMLAGLGQVGTMAMIRRALQGAVGPELFNAVIVIGVLAPAAEEVFFRGYMQSRLAARWPPWVAVGVTSACFGVLHLEWLHALLAFVIGFYFGALSEMTGSVLPAIACHVVNNSLSTVLTAAAGTVEAFRPNVVLLVVAGAVFVVCLAWLRSSLGTSAPTPPAAAG